MKGYIYKIVNKENGKFYIGSTIEPQKRQKRLAVWKIFHIFVAELGKNALSLKEILPQTNGKNPGFAQAQYGAESTYRRDYQPL